MFTRSNIINCAAVCLLLISAVYFAAEVYLNRSLYTSRFNPAKARELYGQSQWQQSQNVSPIKVLDTWALQHKYTGWKNYVDENKEKLDTEKVKRDIIQSVRSKGISDTQLYSYVGYQYLHGADPTLLNPEHPPFGKYLIGLSIELAHNENVILLVCGLAALVLVFAIVRLQTNSLLPAAVAVLLTATQTLFIDQLIHGPQLELFQITFFLLFLFLLQLYDKTGRFVFIILSGVAFGLLLSIKTVFTHYIFFFVWLLTLIPFTKRFKIKELIAVNAAGILTFIATYAPFFLQGGTFRKWLGVQKYIVIFYKQSGINIIAFAGNYLRLIFTGSWKFWSDNTPVTHYSGWSVMWIVVYAVGLYLLLKLLVTKGQKTFMEIALASFIIMYNGFLFIVPMFPRYLLLLFVPMVLLIGISGKHFLTYEKKSK